MPGISLRPPVLYGPVLSRTRPFVNLPRPRGRTERGRGRVVSTRLFGLGGGVGQPPVFTCGDRGFRDSTKKLGVLPCAVTGPRCRNQTETERKLLPPGHPSSARRDPESSAGHGLGPRVVPFTVRVGRTDGPSRALFGCRGEDRGTKETHSGPDRETAQVRWSWPTCRSRVVSTEEPGDSWKGDGPHRPTGRRYVTEGVGLRRGTVTTHASRVDR